MHEDDQLDPIADVEEEEEELGEDGLPREVETEDEEEGEGEEE